MGKRIIPHNRYADQLEELLLEGIVLPDEAIEEIKELLESGKITKEEAEEGFEAVKHFEEFDINNLHVTVQDFEMEKDDEK